MTTRALSHSPHHAPRHGHLGQAGPPRGYVPSRTVVDQYQETDWVLPAIVENAPGRCNCRFFIENVELFINGNQLIDMQKRALA